MQYEINFNDTLNKIDYADLSNERLIQHFADNGYDFLYVYQNGKFFDVVTFPEFLSGKIFESRDKNFLQHIESFHTQAEVTVFFENNPNVERLVLIDGKDVVCEFNPMIELPLQNNVAKNLMALRYVRFFRREIICYLLKFDKILIIAKKHTQEFISELLPEINFEFVERLKEDENSEIFSNSELILDFYYGKKLRKKLNFKFEVMDFCVIVEKIAFDAMLDYCARRNVLLKFYKLQHYEGLNCLHDLELKNFLKRKSLSQLLEDKNYIDKFATNDFEREFICKRKFFCSPRVDNGYCFTQADCQTDGLIVSNGLRISEFENFNSKCNMHFFGPCTTFGILTSNFETVTSHLNRIFHVEHLDFSAINHGGLHGDNGLNSVMSALNTPVKKGDILVFLDVLNDFPSDVYPNLVEVNDWFNIKKTTSELMFFDFPGHCNADANKIISEGIFADLQQNCIKNFKSEEKFTWFSCNNIQLSAVKADFAFTNAKAVSLKNKSLKN